MSSSLCRSLDVYSSFPLHLRIWDTLTGAQLAEFPHKHIVKVFHGRQALMTELRSC